MGDQQIQSMFIEAQQTQYMVHQEHQDKKIDLTDKLIKASAVEELWALKDFYSVAEFLTDRNFNMSFWEGEENWASLSKEDKSIGYLWKKYPLMIYQKDAESLLAETFAVFPYIISVPVIDFLKADYSIEYEKVKDLISNFPNIKNFSINDLWFYTNQV